MIDETITTENGTKVNIFRNPKYGSWSVKFDKGSIPSKLKGEWTDKKMLMTELNAYLETGREARNRTTLNGAKRSGSRSEQVHSGKNL